MLATGGMSAEQSMQTFRHRENLIRGLFLFLFFPTDRLYAARCICMACSSLAVEAFSSFFN